MSRGHRGRESLQERGDEGDGRTGGLADGRRQTADDRRQRTEDRRQAADGRRRAAGMPGRGRREEDARVVEGAQG